VRVGDTLSGMLTAAAGLAVVLHARTFPPTPGQSIGPAFFPTIVGAAMIALGAALAISGRARGGRLVLLDEWVRGPRMVLNFALVVADVVFYALAVDRLGFFITAFLFLAVLFLAFGVPRRWIAPIAAAVTLAMHYAFYTALRVPLAWGVLEGIAW